MKKHSKAAKQSPSGSAKGKPKRSPTITIGMDLGDKSSRYCVLEEDQAVEQGSVATTRPGMARVFGARKGWRIAVEAGGHSAWVSRRLQSWGHEVIVANPRQLQLITHSSRKDDKVDAKTLARLARIDPELLRPIRHRSAQAQQDLLRIRVRAGLVEARTALVNALRGLAKSVGERVPQCDPDALAMARLAEFPAELQAALKPLLEQVDPETELLQQVWGVGTLIALTFCLTLDDRDRFRKSRDVGCYAGLQPKRSQSGQSDPQLRITKEGNAYLRQMLVQGAHRILSPRAPDTDLKRWGERLYERGGKNAKKRAVVAVARKLAVLLHRLWVTGEVYEPLRNTAPRPALKPAA